MLKRLATVLSRRTSSPAPAKAAAEKATEMVEAAVDVLGHAVQSKAPAEKATRLRSAPVAPALLIATGAGVAVWYWTQWARGQAESEAPAKEPSPSEP